MISMKYIHFHIGMCITTLWVFKNDDNGLNKRSTPSLVTELIYNVKHTDELHYAQTCLMFTKFLLI